jgi:hypothetical protein
LKNEGVQNLAACATSAAYIDTYRPLLREYNVEGEKTPDEQVVEVSRPSKVRKTTSQAPISKNLHHEGPTIEDIRVQYALHIQILRDYKRRHGVFTEAITNGYGESSAPTRLQVHGPAVGTAVAKAGGQEWNDLLWAFKLLSGDHFELANILFIEKGTRAQNIHRDFLGLVRSTYRNFAAVHPLSLHFGLIGDGIRLQVEDEPNKVKDWIVPACSVGFCPGMKRHGG